MFILVFIYLWDLLVWILVFQGEADYIALCICEYIVLGQINVLYVFFGVFLFLFFWSRYGYLEEDLIEYYRFVNNYPWWNEFIIGFTICTTILPLVGTFLPLFF